MLNDNSSPRTESNVRSDTLHREGLLKPKSSSVLGIGRSDIASFGASDALTDSLYLQSLRSLPPKSLSRTKAPEPQHIPSVSQGQWRAPVASMSNPEADEVRQLM